MEEIVEMKRILAPRVSQHPVGHYILLTYRYLVNDSAVIMMDFLDILLFSYHYLGQIYFGLDIKAKSGNSSDFPQDSKF